MIGENMPVLNKSALINEIAERTEQTKAATERFVSAFQDVIIEAVSRGEEVKLTGFAAFARTVRAPRIIKSPRNGESIEVPETKAVRIRPLKHFRDVVRESND
jgi:DNA-binding protein HU-beta